MNSKMIYETEMNINDINYILTIKEDANYYTVEVRPHNEYYNKYVKYYYKNQFAGLRGVNLHHEIVNHTMKQIMEM